MTTNSLPSGHPAAVPAPAGAVPEQPAAEPSLAGVVQTVLILLALLVLIPGIDLAVSRVFFDAHWVDPARNFYFRQAYLPNAVSALIHLAALAGGFALAFTFLYSILTKQTPRGLNSRAWGFLFAAFLLGPALLTNVVFKDHWHRARPAQIEQFGGQQKRGRKRNRGIVEIGRDGQRQNIRCHRPARKVHSRPGKRSRGYRRGAAG